MFSDCTGTGMLLITDRIAPPPSGPDLTRPNKPTAAMKARDTRKENKKTPTKTAKEKKLAKLEKKKKSE